MKTKKFVSVLCACAMLLSALPFASAAEPLSEFAGQTIQVGVTHVAEDNTTRETISVYIPEGTSESEAGEIIYTAARGVNTASNSRSARSGKYDNIFTGGGATGYYLNTNWRTITKFTLTREYEEIAVSFGSFSNSTGASQISLMLGDTVTNVLSQTGKITNGVCEIVFFNGGTYGGEADFSSGKIFDLTCKLDSGTITCKSVQVWGQY